VQRSSGGGAPTAFSQHYPDYNGYSSLKPRQEPLERWGASPEFQIFADSAAREQWGRLHSEEDRIRFIEAFWSGLNKEEILRRIAYADGLWGTEYMHGSLSDRGKVFVLLGVPSRVYTKPLTRDDGAFIPRRSPEQMDGTLERWVYFRDQLPPGIKQPAVEYRFITQAGYGDHVMEKDFWALKALGEAKKQR
jgi:GWxTD domain-containing protein